MGVSRPDRWVSTLSPHPHVTAFTVKLHWHWNSSGWTKALCPNPRQYTREGNSQMLPLGLWEERLMPASLWSMYFLFYTFLAISSGDPKVHFCWRRAILFWLHSHHYFPYKSGCHYNRLLIISSYSPLPTFSSHGLLNAKHFQINYFIHCSSVEYLLCSLGGNTVKLNVANGDNRIKCILVLFSCYLMTSHNLMPTKCHIWLPWVWRFDLVDLITQSFSNCLCYWYMDIVFSSFFFCMHSSFHYHF